MKQTIKNILQSSISVKSSIANDDRMLDTIQQVSQLCIDTFRADGKILFCGNGGSAADAQHLAAEFSGRFYLDRAPLFAEALHVNSSYLTSVANDYSYDEVFSRLVQAKARQGDLLIGLSTSGNSPNIVKAFEQAKSQGVITIGMTGAGGGTLKHHSDYLINAPSQDTPRIQEAHITIGHIICEITESALFNPQ